MQVAKIRGAITNVYLLTLRLLFLADGALRILVLDKFADLRIKYCSGTRLAPYDGWLKRNKRLVLFPRLCNVGLRFLCIYFSVK